MTEFIESLLEAVDTVTKKKGDRPTVRELMRAANIKSMSVIRRQIVSAKESGLLFHSAGKSRSIRLTDKGKREIGI